MKLRNILFIFALAILTFDKTFSNNTCNTAKLNVLFEKSHQRHFMPDSVLSNTSGDLVWMEYVEPNERVVYYWNRVTGVDKIEITNDLISLGLEPVKLSCTVTQFGLNPIFLDDYGNVFLTITHKSTTNLIAYDYGISRTNNKLGIWNKTQGFKLIDTQGVENILKTTISSECIVISGIGSERYKTVGLEMPRASWQQDDSPWINLEIGDIGTKLYAMGELYKLPKSWFNFDNSIISVMIEIEAASILDVLNYQSKKSLALMEKAREEGKANHKAEEENRIANDKIENLLKYLDSMNISYDRIISLELPSDKWNTN